MDIISFRKKLEEKRSRIFIGEKDGVEVYVTKSQIIFKRKDTGAEYKKSRNLKWATEKRLKELIKGQLDLSNVGDIELFILLANNKPI